MNHDAPADRKSGSLGRASSIFDLTALPRPAILASFASNILNLALPLVVLQIYDRIIPNQSLETLIVLISAVVVVVALDAMLKVARSHLLGWLSAERAAAASIRAAAMVAGAPCADLSSKRATDWLDGIEAAGQIELGRGGQAQLVLLDFLFLPTFLIVIALIAGPLVFVPLAIMCALGYAIWRLGARLGDAISDRNRHDRRRFDFLTECLGSIESVKAMAMEPQMVRRFELLVKASSVISMRTIAASQTLQLVAGVMANVTLIAVVSTGALLIVFGDLTVGGLACCSLLSGRLMQPIMRAAGVWAEVQNQQFARQRYQPLEQLVQSPGTAKLPARVGAAHIVLDQVSYADDGGRKILDGLSIEIEPGEIVGLTGDNGGWSSAFDIICGDRAASGGRVLVDGVAAHEIGSELRREIVRVSSSSKLFHGTVLENLTLFEGGEAVDRARAIAREIGLEGRINRLPKGFDTEVGGSANSQLPGGVSQQIAITRALVREPRALLFNEANTALDAEGDAALRGLLGGLAGQMSVLIISNRPSLLNIATRRLTLADGRLAKAHPDRNQPVPPSQIEMRSAG